MVQASRQEAQLAPGANIRCTDISQALHRNCTHGILKDQATLPCVNLLSTDVQHKPLHRLTPEDLFQKRFDRNLTTEIYMR